MIVNALPDIRTKRAYATVHPLDGQRILVDRIWPRGVKRHQLALTAWMKYIAPTPDLRRWFGHDPQRWEEFVKAYELELDANPDAVKALAQAISVSPVTLIFGASDLQHNHARVLASYMMRKQAKHIAVPHIRIRPGSQGG